MTDQDCQRLRDIVQRYQGIIVNEPFSVAERVLAVADIRWLARRLEEEYGRACDYAAWLDDILAGTADPAEVAQLFQRLEARG